MADKALCSILDCGKQALARGYCSTHYSRIIRKGYKRPPTSPCIVDGCARQSHGRGYCIPHYKRFFKYGDPLAGGTPHGEAHAYINTAIAEATKNECFIWPYSKNLHGMAQIRKNKKSMLVSRIICEMTKGPPPTPRHQAAHLCGRGHTGCINPHHLEWKTQSENEKDKLIHGTHNRGDRNWNAKLTNADALEILALCKSGVKQSSIAKRFHLSPSSISRLVTGDNWAWLKEET